MEQSKEMNIEQTNSRTKTSTKLFRVLPLSARESLKQNDATSASSSRELLKVNKSH